MKSKKTHIIIGTVICAATMLLFFAFWGKIPDIVPVQIRIDGSVGTTLPKPLFVFGAPLFFAVLNVMVDLRDLRKEDSKIYKFYIIPIIAVILSVVWIVIAFNLG